MADRQLPTRQNDRLDVIDNNPEKWQEFVDKRKLGKTDIPGEPNKKNKQLDYAYVKVPLPRDLKGSGIFNDRVSGSKGHYYLMRRSKDGYISATGMFKLAFPWASLEEEEAEKTHLKSLDGADPHELAGNVWIPVPEALELADEYNLRNWLLVLLDPKSMSEGVENAGAAIKSPPVFKITAKHRPKNKVEKEENTPDHPVIASKEAADDDNDAPKPTVSVARKRVTRSQSPEKGSSSATPARKIATPSSRKPRGRPAAASKLAPTTEEGSEAEASDSIRASTEADSSPKKTKARKSTEQKSTAAKTAATTSSSEAVNVTPSPEKSLRQDAHEALGRANAAIKEATDLTLSRSAGKKRKARDMEIEDEAIDLALGGNNSTNATKEKEGAVTQGSSKRIRVNELEFRKEKVLRRTGMGIAASLAVGLMVPILGGFLQNL